MAKTNRQLAEMIKEFFDPQYACDETKLALAAAEVLAATDVPETQLHVYHRLTVDQGDHSFECELHEALAKDEPDVDLGELANSKVLEAIDLAQGAVVGVLDRNAGLPGGEVGTFNAAKEGWDAGWNDFTTGKPRQNFENGTWYAVFYCRAYDCAKWEIELGNMGVALGMVEGQRDDLLARLEVAIPMMVAHPDCIADCQAVVDKCKAGETEQPALVRLPGSESCDFVLREGCDGCWIAVNNFVVYIHRDKTSVIAGIFADPVDEPLSTAKATFGQRN